MTTISAASSPSTSTLGWTRRQVTDLDRAYFCNYHQAIAAIPDELPFKSNGHQHVVVNWSTGHRMPCADAYMASGYLAGSTALHPQWDFCLEMGSERVEAFPAHPRLHARLADPKWAENEERQRNAARDMREVTAKAQQAFDAVMCEGVEGLVDEPY